MLPHLPQLAALPLRSTHVLPHRVSRAAQAAPHLLSEQTWPDGHAVPHAPQFALSVVVSAHAPLHIAVQPQAEF